MTAGVRVPQVADLRYAIELYYRRTEITTSEIIQLFGGIGRARAAKLKDLARAKMAEEECIIFNPSCVNTESAYRTWGLDITSLERRYKKLQSLKEVTV